MYLIGYFGDILAEKTGKERVLARGLLRLSIKDYYGYMPKVIQYHMMRNAIEKSLKKRLEKLRIPNPDEIINQLLKELIEKQSLFTMAIEF